MHKIVLNLLLALVTSRFAALFKILNIYPLRTELILLENGKCHYSAQAGTTFKLSTKYHVETTVM